MYTLNAWVKAKPKVVPQLAVQTVAEEKQYLTFMLGGKMLSLGILCIKETLWYAILTEVFMMPACIRGFFNGFNAIYNIANNALSIRVRGINGFGILCWHI